MRTVIPFNQELRFAVLRHSGFPERVDHYDLLLETTHGESPEDTALMKFETTSQLHSSELTVEYKGNIRRRYLQYEGPMSGNRGRVIRIDEGTYVFYGVSKGIDFNGKRLKGVLYPDSGSPCESLKSIKDTRLFLRK
jgi:hypothetical protein